MLGLLLFICLANGSGLPLLADPDSHWHIAVGNWMLAHGTVPTVDPFSFTFGGQPWIAKEWLSQLLMAVAFKLGGWGGVTVLAATALAVSFALMLRLLLRDLRPLPAALFALGRHRDDLAALPGAAACPCLPVHADLDGGPCACRRGAPRA